jgi:hypothetical protein
LKKALRELSLALARQTMERQQQQEAHVKDTAKILTKISKLIDDSPDAKIVDLGLAFADACDHGFGPGRPPIKGLVKDKK